MLFGSNGRSAVAPGHEGRRGRAPLSHPRQRSDLLALSSSETLTTGLTRDLDRDAVGSQLQLTQKFLRVLNLGKGLR